MASGPEVLFVDDEDSIRLTLPLLLQSHGFKVTAAASVPDALRLIGERQFDVLIADLNIARPGDGFILVNAMRSMQPNAVRFILTGYPDFESALQALRDGVDDYLIKPAEVEEIVGKVRTKLSGKPASEKIATKPLAAVIRREQEYITAKWLEIAKQDPELGAIQMTDANRKDHVPRLLTVAVGVLEGQELTAENRTAAAQHGQARRKQGYLAPWLVREAKLLQDAVAVCIHRNLLEIQISSLIPDMVRIFGIVQTLGEESLSAFLTDNGTRKPKNKRAP